MLSWSSKETNAGTIDLDAVANGREIDVDLGRGAELLRYASACTGTDDDELEDSRAALVSASEESFMVDAAAVAANFEMMTRVADGTGAKLPDVVLEQRVATIGAMGVARLVSRR